MSGLAAVQVLLGTERSGVKARTGKQGRVLGEVAHLRQAVHPPLASVLHEVGQPLFPVVRLLFAEGLKETPAGRQDRWSTGGGTGVRLTRVMAASSSAPPYLKVMRCFSISAKYSLASLLVLVPKPATQTPRLDVKGKVWPCVGAEEPTFVVLDVPAFVVLRLFLPLFKLWDAVEGHLLLVLGGLFAAR